MEQISRFGKYLLKPWRATQHRGWSPGQSSGVLHGIIRFWCLLCLSRHIHGWLGRRLFPQCHTSETSCYKDFIPTHSCGWCRLTGVSVPGFGWPLRTSQLHAAFLGEARPKGFKGRQPFATRTPYKFCHERASSQYWCYFHFPHTCPFPSPCEVLPRWTACIIRENCLDPWQHLRHSHQRRMPFLNCLTCEPQ